jgi:hypothetical protein
VPAPLAPPRALPYSFPFWLRLIADNTCPASTCSTKSVGNVCRLPCICPSVSGTPCIPGCRLRCYVAMRRCDHHRGARPSVPNSSPRTNICQRYVRDAFHLGGLVSPTFLQQTHADGVGGTLTNCLREYGSISGSFAFTQSPRDRFLTTRLLW